MARPQQANTLHSDEASVSGGLATVPKNSCSRGSVGVEPAVKSRICAIITTYRPAESLPELVNRASRQVERVFLVNDSGSSEIRQALEAAFSDFATVEIRHMPDNAGIASALNCGLRAATMQGFGKALLLDDDTKIESNIASKLLQAWRWFESAGYKPGVIGVSRIGSLQQSEALAKNGVAPGWRRVKGVITAGSMIDIAAANRIGGFREDFIIDGVDYEFCARARGNGLLVARLSDPLMEQPVGNATTRSFAGMTISTTNHSPLRRYYMYRNNVIFAKEQLLRDFPLSLAIVYFLIKTLLKVACFETQRSKKLKAMYSGVLDGIKGKTGLARRSF